MVNLTISDCGAEMHYANLSASERRTLPPAVAVSTVAFALRPPLGSVLGDTVNPGPTMWIPLVRRTRAPFLGLWALPGGPTRWNETLTDTALRALHDVVLRAPGYLEQLYSFGGIERSAEAQRLVTIAYWALYGEHDLAAEPSFAARQPDEDAHDLLRSDAHSTHPDHGTDQAPGVDLARSVDAAENAEKAASQESVGAEAAPLIPAARWDDVRPARAMAHPVGGGKEPSGALASAYAIEAAGHPAEVSPESGDEDPSDPNVAWFSADALPELAFDHAEIVAYALERLRLKTEYSAIAYRFLGPVFTLGQLRAVHEAVLGERVDPANFRRQALARGNLIDTGDLETGTPHRPARLYKFREDLTAAIPR